MAGLVPGIMPHFAQGNFGFYGLFDQAVIRFGDPGEKILRGILSARNLWPRPPEEVPHEGSNNWERLSNDLEILLLWAREMHQHAMRWEGEGEQPGLGETLMKIADEAANNEHELRRLVAMLDPQALD